MISIYSERTAAVISHISFRSSAGKKAGALCAVLVSIACRAELDAGVATAEECVANKNRKTVQLPELLANNSGIFLKVPSESLAETTTLLVTYLCINVLLAGDRVLL